jgi:hypothetical protein
VFWDVEGVLLMRDWTRGFGPREKEDDREFLL